MSKNDFDEAVESLLHFVENMNEWERKMYYWDRLTHDRFVKETLREKYKNETYEELMKEYFNIINENCVSTGELIGCKPYSWGKPPTYNGIDKSSIIEINSVTNDKIEIITKSDCFYIFFKFMLIKNDKWLIEGVFTKNSKDEWDKHYV